MRARYLMEDLALADHVDGIYYSACVGHKKPSPEFFHEIVRSVNRAPGELLLVDDSAENVRCAVSAGWNAVHWSMDTDLNAARSDSPEIYLNPPPIARSALPPLKVSKSAPR